MTWGCELARKAFVISSTNAKPSLSASSYVACVMKGGMRVREEGLAVEFCAGFTPVVFRCVRFSRDERCRHNVLKKIGTGIPRRGCDWRVGETCDITYPEYN